MKNFTLTLFTMLTLVLTSQAQTWTPLYTYPIQDAVWDQPRVDVSADDVIIVSMETIRTNRPMERSTDGGQTWTTLLNSFQRGYVGFDSNNNLYAVTEKKNQGVSTNYTDSLLYSSNQGTSFQAILDLPNNSNDRSSYYISGDDDFYTIINEIGPNLEQVMGVFNAGQQVDSIFSPFSVGSSALRGFIKLSNGTLVASSFNSGVYYSTDNGSTWTASQGDQGLGTSTFTSFAQANNGTLFLAGVSLWQSTDSGQNWAQASLTLNFVSHVRKAGNGTLYALATFASPQLYESTDNGATWVGLQNEPGAEVKDFDVSDNYLYAIFEDSTLYRTPVSSGSGMSVDENTAQTGTFKAFPNPAAGDVTIATENYTGNSWHITLTNALGQIVYQAEANGEYVTIPNSAFKSPGLFTASITNAEGGLVHQIKLIRTR